MSADLHPNSVAMSPEMATRAIPTALRVPLERIGTGRLRQPGGPTTAGSGQPSETVGVGLACEALTTSGGGWIGHGQQGWWRFEVLFAWVGGT